MEIWSSGIAIRIKKHTEFIFSWRKDWRFIGFIEMGDFGTQKGIKF